MMSWTSTQSAPPMLFRLMFLTAVIFPGLKFDNKLLPASLVCFWALTSNGYAYSFMPTSEYMYAIVMIGITLWKTNKYNSKYIDGLRLWKIFFVYVLVVNIVSQLSIVNLTYSTIVILLFPFFIQGDTKTSIVFFDTAFMVLTIIISYYVYTMKDNIAIMMFADQDRVSWVDPNYMGMQVGMGALIGLINMIKFPKLNLVEKVLSPVAFFSAIPAVLLTGSRGSALCIFGGLTILLLSNRTKFIYKALVFILVGYFMVQLYNQDYFDLLYTRIQDDDGTGAGRTMIWQTKLQAFFEMNPFFWIFGLGFEGGLRLGFSRILGFHNDYVAFLCMYGFIGITLFLSMLFYPIRIMNRKSPERFEILACMFYLIIACLTLEPFEGGVIAFMAFLFYLYLKANNSRDCNG